MSLTEIGQIFTFVHEYKWALGVISAGFFGAIGLL
jgi:hypothetical protein